MTACRAEEAIGPFLSSSVGQFPVRAVRRSGPPGAADDQGPPGAELCRRGGTSAPVCFSPLTSGSGATPYL